MRAGTTALSGYARGQIRRNSVLTGTTFSRWIRDRCLRAQDVQLAAARRKTLPVVEELLTELEDDTELELELSDDEDELELLDNELELNDDELDELLRDDELELKLELELDTELELNEPAQIISSYVALKSSNSISNAPGELLPI